MRPRAVALCAAGILLLLCVQPALGIPDAISYEQYVTLVHDQSYEGGCQGYSYVHVLEILKELEAPYTPDPSYAYLNYVFWMATSPDTGTFADPRIPHDPDMGGVPILRTYGVPPETSYPTNFDILGKYPIWLGHPPSQTAFNEALDYRVQDNGNYFVNDTPSVEDAEECIAIYGPLICNQLFPSHTVALIGYDRTAQEFTIVDSANWAGVGHAAVKKVPYADFAARQMSMTLEALENRPTPLVHPYTARVRISHQDRRSLLTAKIGAVGHDPVTVWDRNNQVNYTDSGTDLAIDVPLPAYAAEHWPPSAQNQWYIQITNHADPASLSRNAYLEEFTLARRYQPVPTSSGIACEVYTKNGLPLTISPGTVDLNFLQSIRVTSPNGGEIWTGGERRTTTWDQVGLDGTNVEVCLIRAGDTLPYLVPVTMPAQAGTKDWQLPTDIEPGSDYYVRVRSKDNYRINDTSDTWLTVRSPAAAFTANPVTGLTPLAVQFTDTSTGEPVAWSWTFGDGQTSTAQSPSHAYSAAGTYWVSLNVTYTDGGSRKVYKPNLITVYGSLDPGFEVGSRIGYAPYSAAFTDTTTGNPTSWSWDFGDGTASTAKNPVHTYQTAGTYTVRLIVSNPVAGTKTATKTDYIRVLPLYGGLIRVQAEDYDYDHPTEGEGYHDTTAGNSGGAYRSEDVDIAAITPTLKLGYVVTDIAEGEWTRYWVQSPAAVEHDYPLSLRLAGWGSSRGQTISVTVVGMAGSIDVAVPATGSETSYAYVNTTLRLKPGMNVVRFTYHGSAMNFDYFTLDPAGVMPTPTPTPGGVGTVPGAVNPPTSITVAGKYDDVNGNGRKDFADVVLYFTQISWIAANEPVAAFDYNGNGRVDFADVVWLFNHL